MWKNTIVAKHLYIYGSSKNMRVQAHIFTTAGRVFTTGQVASPRAATKRQAMELCAAVWRVIYTHRL